MVTQTLNLDTNFSHVQCQAHRFCEPGLKPLVVLERRPNTGHVSLTNHVRELAQLFLADAALAGYRLDDVIWVQMEPDNPAFKLPASCCVVSLKEDDPEYIYFSRSVTRGEVEGYSGYTLDVMKNFETLN